MSVTTATCAVGQPTNYPAASSDSPCSPSSKRKTRLATWEWLDRLVWVVRMIGYMLGSRSVASPRSAKSSATMGLVKSPRSPGSVHIPAQEARGGCSRWWSCQKVYAFPPERRPAETADPPIDKEEVQKEAFAKCLESELLPPVARSLQQDEASLELSKKPMLPLEALHRVVSPAARANAPAFDFDIPPQFCIPAAAFASACDEQLCTSPRPRPRRRTLANVSFANNAEWVYLDEEDPAGLPVLQELPLKSEDDGGGDRRAYDLHDGIGAATPKAFPCGVDCDPDSTPRASQLADVFCLREEEVVATTPKASLVLPISLERHCCESLDGDATPRASQLIDSSSFKEEVVATTPKASLVLPIPIDRHCYENLDGDATPRHNPFVKLDFSFGCGASDEENDDRGSATSEPSDSELDRSDLDTRTPKASAFVPQFAMCSELADASSDNEDTKEPAESSVTFARDSSPRDGFREISGFHLCRPAFEAPTPKASSRQGGNGFGFRDAVHDVATPPQLASASAFGFCDAPPAELGGGSESDVDSPVPPSLGLFRRSAINSPCAVEAW